MGVGQIPLSLSLSLSLTHTHTHTHTYTPVVPEAAGVCGVPQPDSRTSGPVDLSFVSFAQLFRRFPFDTQRCDVQFATVFHGFEVVFVVDKEPVNLDFYVENSGWRMVKGEVSRNFTLSESFSVSQIHFVHLSHKTRPCFRAKWFRTTSSRPSTSPSRWSAIRSTSSPTSSSRASFSASCPFSSSSCPANQAKKFRFRSPRVFKPDNVTAHHPVQLFDE